jgi:hypothetical protein
MFGTVLWAVVVGRLKLPSAGRGTERDIGEVDGVAAPDLALEGSDSDRTPFCGGRGTLWFMAICAGCDGAFRLDIAGLLAPWFDIAAGLELLKLCGGRGTKRPAGCGIDLALLDDGAATLWAGAPVFCAAVGLEELAGGVIRLIVGREATAADGLAAGSPAFGPSMLARVGETSGLLILERFRRLLGEILAAFGPTGKPRSRVFRETAVSAPVLA